MRLTNSMMSTRMLADIQASYARLAETTNQVASGSRLQRISDDPVAAAQIRQRRGELDGIDRFKLSASSAETWLSSAESSLGHVGDALQSAREIALQAANGTLQQQDLDRLAQQVDQLAESIKDSLSVRQGDGYLFSGTDSTTAPFTAATGDVPQGGTGAIVRDIGPGVALQLNVQVATLGGGSEALSAAAIAGDGTDGRALAALRTLAANLRSGDKASLGTTDLQAIDANLTVVNDARTAIGAAQNRVEAAQGRLLDLETAADGLRSDLEDTDYAEALTRLALQQTAYQAALRSGAQVIQPSLLDFLR